MPFIADILHVHVDNEVATKPVATEEHYAEHFTCSTFTLPQGEIIGTGVGAIEPTQILQLDPLRQRAVLSFNGTGQIILAHSIQQATSLAQNVQQAADQGALVTCPATMTVEATGPLWAVGVSSGTSQNTVESQGTVTAPAANASITPGIAAASLPAGTYVISGSAYIDGTPVQGTDNDNIKLTVGGNTLGGNLAVPISGSVVTFGPYTVTVNGAQAVRLNANVAGSAGAIYHGLIYATPVPFIDSSAGLAVGVTQERRNK
jgi:hypothetical protein